MPIITIIPIITSQIGKQLFTALVLDVMMSFTCLGYQYDTIILDMHYYRSKLLSQYLLPVAMLVQNYQDTIVNEVNMPLHSYCLNL